MYVSGTKFTKGLLRNPIQILRASRRFLLLWSQKVLSDIIKNYHWIISWGTLNGLTFFSGPFSQYLIISSLLYGFHLITKAKHHWAWLMVVASRDAVL